MRRLVVGCGYIGLRVASAWRDRGDEVFALTRSEIRAVDLRAQGITPVLGDVTDRTTLGGLPECDTLLYAVGLDRTSGMSQHEVYVDGLRNVLDSIRGRARRMVYVSSTSVYGQDAGEWVDESSPCEPHNDSGRNCFEAEQLVWNLFLSSDAVSDSAPSGANVLRLAGIYGPGRLIARAKSLQAGEPVSGNPEAWLNLIHGDDATTAILRCVDQDLSGETVLVCDDRPMPRRDYYEAVARLVGAPVPQFTEAPAASGAGLNKRCCNRKLREQLQVPLAYPTIEEGLPQALSTA